MAEKFFTVVPPLLIRGFNLGPSLWTVVTLIAIYAFFSAIYNVWFHPLASYPGPLLARTSLLWRMLHSMTGRFHRSIQVQHERYGPVVRVSPNELSFATLESWKAIYGHPVSGRATFPKSEFYDMYGSGYDSGCIGSERNPKTHSRMKKSLTAAFSTKALTEQEPIIQSCVNGFVDAIRTRCASGQNLNMVHWFEMISFDILGEMAFGESFHCVENGQPHFWTDLILKHLFFITLMDNLRRFSILAAIGRYLLPKWTAGIREKHSGFSREKVANRIVNGSTRQDFMTNLVAKVESGEISKEEMTAHASTLIIAGGETVATFLAASTYYLLKNPDVYHRLRHEIRTSFESYSDIQGMKVQQLPYLQAFIQEGLRIYPPGSQGFPRTSPGAIVDGNFVPAGTEVYTSVWTITHDATYFKDPYEFKPERWLDSSSTDAKEASQPFSLGPRGCLGRNFAMLEMGLIITKLHWVFDLKLVKENLDFEACSHMHVMWWKPALDVVFTQVNPS